MFNLLFLQKYGIPKDIINYIESFITEKERSQFSQQVLQLMDEGNIDNFKLLYSLGIKFKEHKNKLNNFFLDAVKKNNIQTAKLLLAIGADVEINQLILVDAKLGEIDTSSHGTTYRMHMVTPTRFELELKPLHIAIKNGGFDMVNLLLKNKADVNAPILALEVDNVNHSFYSEQTNNKNQQFYSIRSYSVYDRSITYQSTSTECDKSISQCLKTEREKLKVNPREFYKAYLKDYCSPLYFGLMHKHTNIAKLLIENGADINFAYCQQAIGSTPSSRITVIDKAAENRDFELVELLLKKGVFHRVRGAFTKDKDIKASDFFIAFVEQEIERKERRETLNQISQLTELLATMNQKINALALKVDQLTTEKNSQALSSEYSESKMTATNINFFGTK